MKLTKEIFDELQYGTTRCFSYDDDITVYVDDRSKYVQAKRGSKYYEHSYNGLPSYMDTTGFASYKNYGCDHNIKGHSFFISFFNSHAPIYELNGIRHKKHKYKAIVL